MTRAAEGSEGNAVAMTHSQAAYVLLRDRIISGEYPAGHLLKEGELAEELKISRTPLREAVRRLTESGLVDAPPHRRARVVGWSLENMYSTYTIRASLESQAAEMAAANCTAEDGKRLTELAEQMEDLYRRDPDATVELAQINSEFHRAVADLSRNTTLIRVLDTVSVQPMLLFAKEHLGHEHRRRVHHQHRDIIDALRTNDAEWAATAMRGHILAARNAGCIAPDHPSYDTPPRTV